MWLSWFLHNLPIFHDITPDYVSILNIPVLQGHAWFIFAEVNADGWV